VECYTPPVFSQGEASERERVREQTTFGQRLRQVRLNAGLSQSGLEERSGIPKARLSRYENGHVLPSIETLGRLATALQVSEASLLGDQREVLEGFYNVLFQRGVRLFSTDQAAKLANAVADILDTLCAGTEAPAASAHQVVATASMASAHAPLDSSRRAEPIPPA
jgi:transcriptional regulator with XRE-family HTH domain